MSQSLETPSGKGRRDENFPIGSWLLPARLRPHIVTFYRFARAIDDIADNPELGPEDKISRLARCEAVIAVPGAQDPAVPSAVAMRVSLDQTGITPRHCLDLISAFKQDAVKRRYRDWAELMAYCRRSADPVGRYLLDLHDEDPALYGFSDPLCSALQVLNHLQDCRLDYRRLDRVYLPEDWLAAEGTTVAALDAAAAEAPLARVLARCVERCNLLLTEAAGLTRALRSPRLAVESGVTLRLAERLAARLAVGDPLAGRVALTRGDFATRGVQGVCGTLSGRWFQGKGAQPARQGQ